MPETIPSGVVPPATLPSHHRFHLLDALRGVAAIVVAFLHATDFVRFPWVVANAPLAVDFFFCLSGFVIAFSYEERLMEKLSLRSFVWARVIRLYPMCFIGLTLGFLYNLIFLLRDHQRPWVPFFLYIQSLALIPSFFHSFSPLAFASDNAAWSLFYEIVANIGYAALVLRRWASSAVFVVLGVLSFVVLTVAVYSGTGLWLMGWQSLPGSIMLGFPRVIFSFVVGVLLCRMYRATRHRIQQELFGAWLSFSLTAVLLLVLFSPYQTMKSPLFTLIVVGLIMPAIVYFGALSDIPKALHPLCGLLGELSYPLYLLHLVCISLLVAAYRIAGKHGPVAQNVTFVAWLLAITIVSAIVARKVETPLRRNIQRRLNGR